VIERKEKSKCDKESKRSEVRRTLMMRIRVKSLERSEGRAAVTLLKRSEVKRFRSVRACSS
jgi:hypothetical protein